MASWDGRYSRRQFIRGAAGAASGAVAMGSAGSLLAACGGSTPTTSAKPSTGAALKRDPNTLIVAMDAFTADFDPASYFLLSAIVPDFGIYDSLMRMNGSSATATKPWLAQKISTNADKSVWTFTLQPGVKYADTELTGIPYRVSVGSRDLAEGVVEVTRRATGEKTRVPVADAVARLREILAAKDA